MDESGTVAGTELESFKEHHTAASMAGKLCLNIMLNASLNRNKYWERSQPGGSTPSFSLVSPSRQHPANANNREHNHLVPWVLPPPAMHLSQWAGLLSLPLWLQFACVNAASNDEDERPYESDTASQQEVLFGLCPDYTSYAQHIQ